VVELLKPRIGELVQVTDEVPHWFRCIVTVDEIKSWGIQGFVTIPAARDQRPGDAYIRLKWSEFICLGALNQYIEAPKGEPSGRDSHAAERQGH
jgi:hypothetical protein